MFQATQLREFRKVQNLTLAQVADEAGMSAGWLSLVERGKCDPKVDNLIKVLTVLGYKLVVSFSQKEEEEEEEEEEKKTRLDLQAGSVWNRG